MDKLLLRLPFMEIKDKDEQIGKLFKSGLGARHIATQLGVPHHGSISKRLMKLGLKRGHCVENFGCLNLKLTPNQEKLRTAAEHYARYFFISCGYDVLTPESGAPYDLAVEFDGKFQKIQVKSSFCKNESGNYCFKLVRTRNNSTGHRKVSYTKDECDFFFLFDAHGNKWLIPHEEIKGTSVVPALRYPGYQIHDPWMSPVQ
jgi:hypothetical protein